MENIYKIKKLKVKLLALEMLRKTEGGTTSIGDIIGGTYGMISPDRDKIGKL